MFRVLVVALVLLGAGLLVVRHLDETSRGNTNVRQTVAAATPVSNSRSMVIRAGSHGHFEVEARVDGRRIGFMVDTGATAIALRASDAARIGQRPLTREYTARVATANGDTLAAPIELRSVEVGDIVVRNLRALVLPDEALGVNLLGMSFLSRVRWTHERGRLVLEQ